MPFADGTDREIFSSFVRNAGFFERLVDEGTRIEERLPVPSLESETRRSAEFVPKRVGESGKSVSFRYPAFHERVRKRIDSEFVAARFRERGDERLEFAGYGISEYGFRPIDGLSDDVLRRPFPSGMDERGEIDGRIAVGKSDDGAVGGR